MQSENLKTRAVILKVDEYGESDKIAVLYTLERGKLRAFAPHAKSSMKRFGAALDTFAHVEAHVSFSKIRSIPYLKSLGIIEYYDEIRKNIVKISLCSYMCELFCEMTALLQKDEKLFYFLR